MTAWETFNCAQCGKEHVRTGTYQKYCPPCSRERASARKQAYKESRKSDNSHRERRNQQSAAISKKLRDVYLPDAGQQRSLTRSINDTFDPPNLEWACRITIPFNKASSKNHIYGINGWHVFKRQDCRRFQAEVEQAARRILATGDGPKPVQNKVWVAIHVEKPNHRFDAINVIDSIADGLKVALGVDDRWFCIRQVDWSINKTDPRFTIEFGQDSLEHVQACSYCGHLQPLTEYGKNADRPLGVHRICRSCTTLASQAKKEARAKSKTVDSDFGISEAAA